MKRGSLAFKLSLRILAFSRYSFNLILYSLQAKRMSRSALGIKSTICNNCDKLDSLAAESVVGSIYKASQYRTTSGYWAYFLEI